MQARIFNVKYCSLNQSCCCCSVAKVCPTLCRLHGLQNTRLPCPPPFLWVCSISCPLSQWRYLTISSSSVPFSFAFNLSHLQGLFQWLGSSHQVAKVLEVLQTHIFNIEYCSLSQLHSKKQTNKQTKRN